MIQASHAPTKAELAYERIEALIVTMQLAPGSVFSEGDLSDTLKIGRTPLREALQRLSADGLVSSMPRRGMVIAPLSLPDILSIVEVRKMLDRIVVAGAATKATAPQRLAIRAAMEEITPDSNTEGFLDADYRLDKAIADACPNQYAARATRPLHTHCRRFWYRYRNNDDLKRSGELHSAMVDAIVTGDGVAAAERSDKLMDYLTLITKHILIAA